METYLGGGELEKNQTCDVATLRLQDGAHEWNRTIDLLLTKEVLYRLSYVSLYLCRPP